MPVFVPIDAGIAFDHAAGTLARLTLTYDALEAEFEEGGTEADLMAGRRSGVRVSFSKVTIVRVADEDALSTEEDEPAIGIVPAHFAYAVTGSKFGASLSSLVLADDRLRHDQFITGGTCLDVIAPVPPRFGALSCRARRRCAVSAAGRGVRGARRCPAQRYQAQPASGR